MIDATSLPPGSIILAYWFGGAFLMAAKRLSEYDEIVASHGKELLSRYRASFTQYTQVSLTASCIAYSLFSIGFLSVFLVKYRIEYILVLPFVVALFTAYFVMATKPGSTAQKPEKLFREPSQPSRGLWQDTGAARRKAIPLWPVPNQNCLRRAHAGALHQYLQAFFLVSSDNAFCPDLADASVAMLFMYPQPHGFEHYGPIELQSSHSCRPMEITEFTIASEIASQCSPWVNNFAASSSGH